jgi:ATP-dependent RNA helicase RhlE
MTFSSFADFDLPQTLVRSLEQAGFTTPTPIQAKAIPAQLQGRDILGIAQTGSGKTAAFALPILAGLMKNEGRRKPMSVGALILAPTRELAVQIDEMIRSYAGRGHLTTALVLGGVSRSAQVQKLARGVDIVVATPGRLCDLLEDRKLRLDETRYLVLDEADRMLDMGFIAPVRKIAAKCATPRQTALFSATMAPEVEKLAQSLLHDPLHVEASPSGTTVTTVDQRVIFSGAKQKRDVLNDLLTNPDMTRVIVFARTKHGADRVSKNLEFDGHSVSAIHGNKSQGARQAALRDFRSGKVRLLVATDIAARGIDVPDISHVINFELPDDAENYVHRIGRTARNGASGSAISLVDGTEKTKLRDVEKLIRKTLPKTGEIAQPAGQAAPASRDAAPSQRRKEGGWTPAGPKGKSVKSGGARKSGGSKPWWAKLEGKESGSRKGSGQKSYAGREQSNRSV